MPAIRFRSLPHATKIYVGLVVVAGAVTINQSFYDLTVNPVCWHWTVLAVLTLVIGSATVRLPSLPATISVSETFVFTSVLLFGPSAGTLTVALDALVISFWSYRKGHPPYKIIFNVCALPFTIWIASHIFFLVAGVGPLVLSSHPVPIKTLLLPLLLFTIVYFTLNSWIITFAIALERNLPAFTVWRDHFVWLSLNYFGGASVAALLVSYTRDLDYTYLAVIVPLLIVLYFTFSMSMGRVEDANRHLVQLNSLYMSTIETLAMAIDAKDQITHGHIRRVQTFAVGLAKEMGVTDPDLIRAIEAASLLHDMGKLAVPEYILNKPGPLTPAEFDKMKLHASVGADILSAIAFPYPVVPIVRHHHEQWNGAGYPDALRGTQIPIGARILSVVDCYDALTSDRPYRPRLSDKEAFRILNERRGSMYDPLVVDTFVRVHPRILPARKDTPDNPVLLAITEASIAPVIASLRPAGLDEIAASTEEMLTLFDLANGLNASEGVPGVGEAISKHLRRLVPYSLIVFYKYETTLDEIVADYAAGDNAPLISSLRIGLGQRLSGWVAANRQTIRNSDPVLDFGDAARTLVPRLRSCLCTPLMLGSELVGVLALYSPNEMAFSEEHQRIVEVVSRQISPILKRAVDLTSKHFSTADSAATLQTIEQVRLQRGTLLAQSVVGQPASVLLIRLDGVVPTPQLSQFNADDVFLMLVRASRSNLRAADLLFRQNGDTLIAIFFQADASTSAAIAGRIRHAATAEVRLIQSEISLTIISATSPGDGDSIGELIESTVARLASRQHRADSGSVAQPPESIH